MLEPTKQIYELAASVPGNHRVVVVWLDSERNTFYVPLPPGYRFHECVPDKILRLDFRALDADRAKREGLKVRRQLSHPQSRAADDEKNIVINC